MITITDAEARTIMAILLKMFCKRDDTVFLGDPKIEKFYALVGFAPYGESVKESIKTFLGRHVECDFKTVCDVNYYLMHGDEGAVPYPLDVGRDLDRIDESIRLLEDLRRRLGVE